MFRSSFGLQSGILINPLQHRYKPPTKWLKSPEKSLCFFCLFEFFRPSPASDFTAGRELSMGAILQIPLKKGSISYSTLLYHTIVHYTIRLPFHNILYFTIYLLGIMLPCRIKAALSPRS